MSDRKAELERKRKKLEEIRRNREEKKRVSVIMTFKFCDYDHELFFFDSFELLLYVFLQIEAGKSAKATEGSPSLYTETDLDRKRREADELLKDIDLGAIKSSVTGLFQFLIFI